MGKSPKPPAAIDVGKVTQQANTQNTQNAYQNSAFNRINQRDQFGNTLNYSQTGTDAQGNPIFNAEQGMGETAQQFAGGLGAMGQRYMDRAGQAPESSMDAMNRAYDSATTFSAPRQAREKEQMSTQLANMGLDPSSEAYRNRMMDVTEQQTGQQNALAASLQGQMFNQGLQGRQQQMNELQPGMQYGQQAMNPNLVNAPQVGVQNVDVAGLANQNQQQQQQNYNAQMQQRGAMMGGLGGIAGTAIGAYFGAPGVGAKIGGGIGNWATSTQRA